jgi:hypothetical protein
LLHLIPGDLAAHRTSRGEPDAAVRQSIYAQLNDIFLDESFMFPVAAAPARFSYTEAWLQS